jgi:hypothetical protein
MRLPVLFQSRRAYAKVILVIDADCGLDGSRIVFANPVSPHLPPTTSVPFFPFVFFAFDDVSQPLTFLAEIYASNMNKAHSTLTPLDITPNSVVSILRGSPFWYSVSLGVVVHRWSHSRWVSARTSILTLDIFLLARDVR